MKTPSRSFRFLGLALLAPFTAFAGEGEKPKEDKAKVEKPAAKPGEAPPAKAAEAPHAVPQKFVPLKPGEPGARGSSGTDLTRKSFDPTALVAMVDLALGDSFPIVDEQGKTRFMVKMTEGDDEHLVLEISNKAGAQKIGVVRNDPSECTVDGVKYELVFPRTSVNSDTNPITHEAMIFVKQRG